MSRLATELLIEIGVLLLIGLALFLWGRNAGKQSAAQTVATCDKANGLLTFERDQQASTIATLRDHLQRERNAAELQRQTAAQQMAAHGKRVTTLQATALRAQTTTLKKAAADEDCAALRDLPVCAAVADGLWGQQATRAH